MPRVISQNGKNHYYHEGYLYREAYAYVAGEKGAYRCVRKSCSGRVLVDQNAVKTVTHDHNHIGDPNEMHVKAVMNDIKERAADTVENPRRLVQSATAGILSR